MIYSALNIVREELRYDSERVRRTLQITISVLLVVIVMLAAQMPFIGIAPYLVFLLSQDETISTRAAAFLASIVTLSGCLLVALLALIAFDAPWLRIPIFILLFYGGFYLMRTFAQPKAVLGLLVILGLVLVAFDQVPTPTYLFTQLAWLIAALAVVIASSLVAGWVTRIPSGRERLEQVLETRMLATERALRLVPYPAHNPYLARPSGERTKLQETLERAILVGRLTNRQGDHYAAIEQLWTDVDDACDAFGSEVEPRGRICLAEALAALRCGILEERELNPAERRAVDAVGVASLPASLLSTTQTLDRVWTRILSEQGKAFPVSESPKMLPDDFGTNPRYASFALRATLATMGCYLLMVTTHWYGIHTCMVTTVATALATTGAQVHKQALRISGAVIGGAVGIFSVIYVLPRFDSLLALLCVVAVGTMGAAWVSLGSARISYAGWQIALAFFMTVLQGPHPATSLDVIWDRWVGIAIGILAMQFAFRTAWPENTVETLRGSIRKIRSMIDGASRPGATPADSGPIPAREISAEIALVADSIEEAALEARFREEEQLRLATAHRELAEVRARFAAALG
ncbi:MAG: FUSC family protein [Myxococcota bacterium]|jgi:multidrug resistance protein MdtO|nr:FUSC family protein [Myxococcota bacterium]